MKRKAIWWFRVGLLALAGASGCGRCMMARKETCPCQCQAQRRPLRCSCGCGRSCTTCPSCATGKPAPAAPAVPENTTAPAAPAAKPVQLPDLTPALPKSAKPLPSAPEPVVVPTSAATKPKVRLILTGTEAAPAKPAAPAAGPPMPSHLPDLDAPAPAENKPAVRTSKKDEEGPSLFPDEPARPSGLELAVAKGPEGTGGAVHAYLPAVAKPDVPALQPVPAPAGPGGPVQPLKLPEAPHEERLHFPHRSAEPARRSFTDVTAAPCFSHAKDYGWLCGRAEYSRLSKGWRLRYASVDQPDRFGGSVTLVPGPKLADLKDGQYVRVKGHLADHAAGLSPNYEVESISPVAHPNTPQAVDDEPDEF